MAYNGEEFKRHRSQMNTAAGTGESGVRFPSGTTLAVIGLCAGMMLAGTAAADGRPAGKDLQIQTTTSELLGEEQAARFRKILYPDKTISWEVYLPGNDSIDLPGVLVYISPTRSGQIDPRWREVMDQQNLIYISANGSGNRKYTNRRMVLATLAVQALAKQFSFDPGKVNVAGFSGGGRVASLVASQYPQAFTGAIYICGVDFWKNDRTPHVDRLLQNRFVFLTGTADFNLMETRRVHQRYLDAGAQYSRLQVVKGMSHELPDAKALTEALQYLLEEE